MNLDFELLLVIGTGATGVIWVIDALFFAPHRRKQLQSTTGGEDSDSTTADARGEASQRYKEPLLVEYARSFFPVILIVLLLRSFLVEPFRIPSGSMLPTLRIGDFILVNKFTYGMRLPVIDNRIINVGEPKRGDVIVFRYPDDPSIDYIKRVVGLPGDLVSYRNKVLYINGKMMPQMPDGSYIGTYGQRLERRIEDLSGVKHSILINPAYPSVNFTVTVPKQCYFAMGDNRDNSRDSRYWGCVPEKNLIGRAFMIWMSWDAQDDSVRWGRIGSSLH